MTKTEYLAKMRALCDEFGRTDYMVTYNSIIDRINKLNLQWSKSLARRQRIRVIAYVCFLFFLAMLFVGYLAYAIWAELSR